MNYHDLTITLTEKNRNVTREKLQSLFQMDEMSVSTTAI